MNLGRYKKFVPVVMSVASMSKDSSTKVGAIALGPDLEIRSVGYNGFPRGVDDNNEARQERPLKYSFVVHAESNVVAQAAKTGASLEGCTVMVSSLYPCSMCTRMMIQAGIKRVISVNVDPVAMERWREEWEVSLQMLEEAEVEFVEGASL